MLKKITILFSILVIILFSACGNEKKVDKINLTYVKSPLNIPSILEKKLGMFDKEFNPDGIKINFYELTTGPEQTNALAAGELDFLHALGGTSAIIAASNGVDLKITNVYSRSPKGFMILSKRDDINAPESLKGKKIGGPKGTILHQVLVGYLAKGNLKESDVEFINMGLPEALTAMESGNIDVALLAGPVALKAIKNGAKVVTTGEGLTQGLVVTAVSGKFLKDNPELVQRFLKVNKEAIKYINENFENTLKITAEDVGLTEEEVLELYPLYDFNPEIQEADIQDLEETQEFLIKNGMQENRIDINSILAITPAN